MKMYLIAALPSVILIILGICIRHFKMYWLISGYNTMSSEKKRNVDILKLGNLMGIFCFFLAGIMFVFILTLMLNLNIPAIAAAVLMGLSIIGFIIYSQRYDANTRNYDGTMKTSSKLIVGGIVAFLLIVFVGVGILLYQGAQEPVYKISQDRIEIGALYGETIYFKDVTELSISENLPKVLMKTNGSVIGSSLKGYFNLDAIGAAKLFVNADQPPFIKIVTKGQTIILNTTDSVKTRELFTNLKKNIN